MASTQTKALPHFIGPKLPKFVSDWWLSVDRPVLALACVLMMLGLLFSLASSGAATARLGIAHEHYFVLRQSMFIALTGSIMLALSTMGPVATRRVAAAIYVLAIIAMVAILFVGHEAKGGQRWLRVPGFSFQPSEVLKPALIVLAAWLFSKRIEQPNFPAVRIAFALFAVPVGLLLAQPDVGQTGLLTLSFLTVFFVAGIPVIWIAGLFFVALLGFGALYLTVPHVTKRVDGFLNPAGSDTYQTDRALDAIASGDILGRGIGEGEIKDFLPDAHTDFIYSVAAEEFGLLASIGVIGLFCALVVRGLTIANRQNDAFAQIAATGLFAMVGFQAAINLSVNLNLMPAKGMTLPFISYGGSSMLGSAITIGLALALTRKRPGRGLREW
jgi:cell division protein FtsW